VEKLLGEITPETFTKDLARKAIQLIGFAVSSLERHFRSEGAASGSTFQLFNGLEPLLVHLSKIAEHPPRDTHYTYWLWNKGEQPLTFTGDSQEIFFNHAVNHTDELHTASCESLRPICEGNVQVDATEGLEAIQQAAENNLILHEHFRSFMAKDEVHNHRAVEPAFFMKRMRTYLPTYQIGGAEWTGVNAANLAAQMQLDYLVGVVVKDYKQTVESRLAYLTDEDRIALIYDLSLRSVGQLLLDKLQISVENLAQQDTFALTAHLFTLSRKLQRALIAYKDLVNACGRLSAIHWALIQNYLIKEAARLSPEEKLKLAVSPDQGTGGKTHAQTEAIMRMRRQHPVLGLLTTATEMMEKQAVLV
jgi:hypothetical protein